VRPSHGRPHGHRPIVRPFEDVRVTTLPTTRPAQCRCSNTITGPNANGRVDKVIQWGSGQLYIGIGQCASRGPEWASIQRLRKIRPTRSTTRNEGARRGRSGGGQDECLQNLRLQIMVPDRGAGWGDWWQNLRLKIKMSWGRANGVGEDEQRAEWNARRSARRGAGRGGRQGARRRARREPCHWPHHF
jgi:hypothetical protein